MMRTLWMGLAVVLGIALAPMGAAQADEGSCSARAAEKKLAGAAKASFLKKCEKDAVANCDAQAGQKKLAGAARTSFTKKCVNDALGG